MKEPINFTVNGPSYQDQMYTKYLELKEKYDCKYFNRIWDECQKQCEHSHNERLRNKLSPITNIISIFENFLNNPDDKLVNKILDNNILIKQCIDSSNKSIEQILDITNQ